MLASFAVLISCLRRTIKYCNDTLVMNGLLERMEEQTRAGRNFIGTGASFEGMLLRASYCNVVAVAYWTVVHSAECFVC